MGRRIDLSEVRKTRTPSSAKDEVRRQRPRPEEDLKKKYLLLSEVKVRVVRGIFATDQEHGENHCDTADAPCDPALTPTALRRLEKRNRGRGSLSLPKSENTGTRETTSPVNPAYKKGVGQNSPPVRLNATAPARA